MDTPYNFGQANICGGGIQRDINEILKPPSAESVLNFHRKQRKLPKSPYIEMLKIGHNRPGNDGIIFSDFRNFLDPSERKKFVEISFGYISEYIIFYGLSGNFDVSKFAAFLKKLARFRRTRILEYISGVDKMFGKFGLSISSVLQKFRLFRYSRDKHSANIFYSYTSWSIYPLHDFCHAVDTCYLYVIEKSVAAKIRGLYIEGDTDATWRYEYEILMPRGLEFKILRSETADVVDPNFRERRNAGRRGSVRIVIYYIEITGVRAIDASKIPIATPEKIEYTNSGE